MTEAFRNPHGNINCLSLVLQSDLSLHPGGLTVSYDVTGFCRVTENNFDVSIVDSWAQVRSTRRSKVPQGRAKVELTAILEQFSKMAAPVQPPSPAPGPLAHSSNGKITPGAQKLVLSSRCVLVNNFLGKHRRAP